MSNPGDFRRAASPLTPEGRRRLCERVDAGRPLCHVAAEASIARETLGKWHARWLQHGERGLHDRSSRPYRSPNQTDPQVEDLICWLRRGMKLGLLMLVAELASQFRSRKVVRTLTRHGLAGSMGRVGAADDNEATESLFGLLQKNVLNRRKRASREQLQIAIITWIELTYHRRRRQARLDRLTPIEFEAVINLPASQAA